jgi:dipeptidase D
MTDSLLDQNPRLVWEHFDEILKVPRPSKREEKIRQWLLDWAKQKKLAAAADGAGNIVIRVPASAGKEKSPTVVLQAHMDMVCEKNEDKTFNFDKDPIEVAIDGEWLKTKGTSMGADNGLGIAAALAVAVDRETAHGPLELLFTVDEETGLTGAFNLDPGILKGKVLLNLDSEDEGTFFVGCAGGADSHIHFPLALGKPVKNSAGLKVKLSGMRGGHSGLNIHENRANAIKVAARMLRDAREKGIKYNLISMDGGDKHNAIPRECTFEVAADKGQMEIMRNLISGWKETFMTEFRKTDPDFRIEFTPLNKLPVNVLTSGCRDKLLGLLMALPHGVLAMSRDIEGLVETSSNVASIHMKKKEAEIVTSSRSSVAPALAHTRGVIAEIARFAGAGIDQEPGYPGWQPDMASKALAKARDVYAATFGKQPHVTAVHAGLECGILGEKVPGMDMLSFGPTLSGVHSPDEKVHIGSVGNFYTFLKALLKAMA